MNQMLFEQTFQDLTGHTPFPWQTALWQRFMAGGQDGIPVQTAIPTGLGKTSVLPIWMIALAQGATLPRRLVYVVNRRTVVDQTTAEAERLKQSVGAGKLANMPELAISTLRGQFADNGDWSADPSKPAIVCGTVDMIGSRLLFSGYRIGKKAKPLHAGFLGQDALLVHDEAHLEPAFQNLLASIQAEQKACNDPWPLQVMALSATNRSLGVATDQDPAGEGAFGLTPEESRPPSTLPSKPSKPIHHVWQRLKANKTLSLNPVASESKDLIPSLVACVQKHQASNESVLVYVRKVEDVKALEVALTTGIKKVPPALPAENVLTLTGTMRGWERDQLVKKPVFQRFLQPDVKNVVIGTVCLIATSAGEVGADLSADHMVCDLSTLDSMAQRLGRLNRRGTHPGSTVVVVHPEKFDDKNPVDPAREKTLGCLRELQGDASPLALKQLFAGLGQAALQQTFSPEPATPPVSDMLFDAWAMTSISGAIPGRPPVAPYLHGLSTWEPPRTRVAWREEVQRIHGDLLNQHPPETLLDLHPLRSHELLEDRTDRVLDGLQSLAKRFPDREVWLIDAKGEVTCRTLAKLADPDKTKKADRQPLEQVLAEGTVLLAPDMGGLKKGHLHGRERYDSEEAYDVSCQGPGADGSKDAPIGRMRLDESFDRGQAGCHKHLRLVRSIELPADAEDSDAPSVIWRWYDTPRGDGSSTPQNAVTLKTHVDDVVKHTQVILAGLGSQLPDWIHEALLFAAKHHDDGKNRILFQKQLGNQRVGEILLAKSAGKGASFADHYRHELGSVFDAENVPGIKQLSADQKDLALHVIACHHGRGRPGFDLAESFDPMQSEADANALVYGCVLRYTRLQASLGRWGLAYVESVLRAADWAASAEPSAFCDVQGNAIVATQQGATPCTV